MSIKNVLFFKTSIVLVLMFSIGYLKSSCVVEASINRIKNKVNLANMVS